MNVITRGVRNAFRNTTRTISIVLILGLSIGLSIVMLIANQAVDSKIKATLESIGNTINVFPAGSGGGSITAALTNAQLDKIKTTAHVKSVSGVLGAIAQPEGTTNEPLPPEGANTQGQSNTPANDKLARTTLKAPFDLDCQKGSCSSGNSGSTNVGTEAPKFPSNFSLPIQFVGSNVPTDPGAVNASSLKILSGSAIDGNKDTDEAMISQAMADKNNLKLGDTFKAFGVTIKVKAIFDTNTRTGNSTVIMPLPALQRYTNQKNIITSAVATVDTLENLEAATTAIQKALGSAADVTSPLDEAKKAIEPLQSVKSISLYSLVGAVVAGAVIILLTMIMIVRERKREIGVLKAIGFSNVRIMVQFMNEALTFTILAALIGVGLGMLAGGPVTSALVKNSGETQPGIRFENAALNSIRDVQAAINWEIVLYGLGAALLIALVGSALASFFIAKVRPAEVLRSE